MAHEEETVQKKTCLKTLGFGRIEKTLVFFGAKVSGVKRHPDEEWDAWLAFASDEIKSPNPPENAIFFVDEIYPSVTQFYEGKKVMPKGFRSSTVTTSTFAKSVTNMYSVINKNVHAYRPKEINKALDNLGIPTGERSLRISIMNAAGTLRKGCAEVRNE